MNHSFYSADRMTHLKIVVIALVAAIGVAGVSITARVTDDGYTQTAQAAQTTRVTGAPFKANKAVVMTSSDATVVR